MPIPYVLEQAGVTYETGSDGKVHALCPFHDDNNPSFDVFDEGWSRWGCYPCARGGDVLDLMQGLGLAKGFTAALFLAESYAQVIKDTGWLPPAGGLERVASLDLATASSLVASSYTDLTGLDQFLASRGDPFSGTQLQASWGVGSVGQTVVMPYWDQAGELVTYKYRSPSSKPYAAKGGRLTALYGEWRDDTSLPAFIAEGESDAWAASFWLRGQVSVLGLPSSGTPPEAFAARFSGRVVILALDGDKAGVNGSARWGATLSEAGARVCGLPVPAGQDLRSLGALLGYLDIGRLVG